MYCECYAKGFSFFIKESSVVKLVNASDAKTQKIPIDKENLTVETTRKFKDQKIPIKSLSNQRKGLATAKNHPV